MSRSHTKSSKPVTTEPIYIDLKKTRYGYELIGDKGGHTISLNKSMLAKTDKGTKDTKESVHKGSHKGAASLTPDAFQKTSTPSKSKSAMKATPNTSKNVAPTPSVPKEKAPAAITEIEIKRREVFPFTMFTVPLEESTGPHQNNIQTDPNISGDLNKVEKTAEGATGEVKDETKKKDKTKKKYPLIIPSSANWFKFDEIHQTEKDELPEFFAGKPSKTPEIYKRYRNYIIDLYSQNPRVYLNSTKCRKNLGGDACAIMRIHSLLEQWGLINFTVAPKNTQDSTSAKRDENHKNLEDSNNDERIDLFDQDKKSIPKSAENEQLLNQLKILTKKYRPVCDFCGVICGLIWYKQKAPIQLEPGMVHTSKENESVPSPERTENQGAASPSHNQPPQNTAKLQPKNLKELILCLKCYSSGNIPNIFSTHDFNKIDILNRLSSSTSDLQEGMWSEEDDARLLDLIQKHSGNWDEIQKDFPNKATEDLILHYLQLPLTNISSITISETKKEEEVAEGEVEKPTVKIIQTSSEYSNPILQHVKIFKDLLEKYKQKIDRKQKSTNFEQVKTEQDISSLKDKANTEIIKIQEDDNKLSSEQINGPTTMEIEEKKEEDVVKSEEKGELNKKKEMEEENKELIINDSEFDFERIELERAHYERGNMEGKSHNIGHFDDKILRKKEEDRIFKIANKVVDLQINKLGDKLNFLDEYEKILWQERRYQELFQKDMIAERVSLAHKRREMMRQEPHDNMYDNKDPTAMLNLNSNISNVDDMICLGNNDKIIDEYSKDSF